MGCAFFSAVLAGQRGVFTGGGQIAVIEPGAACCFTLEYRKINSGYNPPYYIAAANNDEKMGVDNHPKSDYNT